MRQNPYRLVFLLAGFLLPGWLMAQAPANDAFCNATELTIDAKCNQQTNGDVAAATLEPDEPRGTCLSTQRGSVWYRFTAPESGFVVISTNYPVGNVRDLDVTLYTLSGDNCQDLSTLTQIGCNRDESASFGFKKATISTVVNPGETYYIQVLPGRDAKQNEIVQSFCITVEAILPPTNDEPLNAIKIDVADTCKIYNNLLAGSNGSIEQAIAPEVSSSGWNESEIQRSVWFTFEVPATGGVAINTYDVFAIFRGKLNTTFNTQLAVYRVEDPRDFATFSLLGANDDAFSELAGLELNCLTPGEILYVMVDGSPAKADQNIPASGKFLLDIKALERKPIDITGAIADPSCENKSDGSILTQVKGGVPPYTYNWSNGATQSRLFRRLAPGDYQLTVTDQCDTLRRANFTLSAPSSLKVALGEDITFCETDRQEVSLAPQIEGGNPFSEKRFYSLSFNAQSANHRIIQYAAPPSAELDTLTNILPEDFRTFRMTYFQDKMVALSIGNNVWYEIDPATQTVTILDTLPPPGPGEFWQGITCDPFQKTLYAMAGGMGNGGTPYGNLYEIDLESPDITLNATFDSIAPLWITMDTTGTLFAADFFTDQLLILDQTFQQAQKIGQLSIDADRLDDAYVDPTTNALIAISNTQNLGATLWQIDKSTAQLDSMGNILGTQALTGLAIGKETLSHPYDFSWKAFPSWFDSTSLSQTFTPISDLAVRFQATDACGTTAADTLDITIAEPPILTSQSTPDRGNGNGTAFITIENGTPPYEITWSTGNQTDTVYNLTSGVYTVSVSDASGCEATDTVEVFMEVSTHTGQQLTAGIQSVQLYPNPATDEIRAEISLFRHDQISLYLYDLQGQVLQMHSIPHAEKMDHSFSLANLSRGMYVIQIQTSQGIIAERILLE